jgi:hypothetical protein
MPVQTHMLAMLGEELVSSIPLVDGKNNRQTLEQMRAKIVTESEHHKEPLTFDRYSYVSLLADGDPVPNGWRVVYVAGEEGYLPFGAALAISEIQ